MNFLLDTNTVIYLINDRLAMALPAGRYGVSVITEIELLSFPDLQVDEDGSFGRMSVGLFLGLTRPLLSVLGLSLVVSPAIREPLAPPTRG